MILTSRATISQSVWFDLLCIVGVAAFLTLQFFGLRRRFSKSSKELVKAGGRSAPQLHDALLQDLQGLMFRLQAVRQLLPARPVDAASLLDRALEGGDRAITDGRNVARNLHESPLTQSELSKVLIALGKEFAFESKRDKPNYQILIEGQPRDIDSMAWDQIYQLTREAIGNAFKHAEAANIEADLSFGHDHMSIRVRDDGIGIDRTELRERQRDGRKGLSGMRKLANFLGAEFNVWSEIGAGTEIELRFSARIVYAVPRAHWRLLAGTPPR